MIKIIQSTTNPVIYPYLESNPSDFVSSLDCPNGIVLLKEDGSLKKYIFIKLPELETVSKFRSELTTIVQKQGQDLALNLEGIPHASLKDFIESATETYLYVTYQLQAPFSKPKTRWNLEIIGAENLQEYLEKVSIIGESINNARNLSDTPANYLVPSDLEKYAIDLAKCLGSTVTAWSFNNQQLEEMKAGAILGVNRGSDNEARLIVMKYNGDGDSPYTALIGKGLTYDSGGYNLKPNGGAGMKFDMCGASSVLGAFEIIARLGLKANVYAIVPSTENMIDGKAYRVDDVLVSLSGKTIEITNTDAEGRLILADAIHYAGTLGVKRIIDVATLTGAVGGALGREYTGAFTNDQAFLEEFKLTTEKCGEPIWQLPVSSKYASYLKKSKVADLVNSVKEGGGASIAACFLQEFVPDGISWIHLDVASTAISGDSSTGVMVKSLALFFE